MKKFSTKQKGDIAEYQLVAELLKIGYSILLPCGDRLPYDIAIDYNGKLVRIQVKSAWFNEADKCYSVDVRRHQTNRQEYRHTKYNSDDFDFLVAWIENGNVFYILPALFANMYAGNLGMSLDDNRNYKSHPYRNAWHLLPNLDI